MHSINLLRSGSSMDQGHQGLEKKQVLVWPELLFYSGLYGDIIRQAAIRTLSPHRLLQNKKAILEDRTLRRELVLTQAVSRRQPRG